MLSSYCFFFNDTATTEIYTLSLHDALPICFHGDCSRMFFVGEPSIQARRLVEVTYECMWIGIRQVRPGARLGDVGAAIQQHAEKHGYSVEIGRASCRERV